MRPSTGLVLFVLSAPAAAQDLADEPAVTHPVWEELRRLRARVEVLEAQPGGAARAPQSVDLSDAELPSIQSVNHDHVLARPWYENIDLYGYAAFTYLDTGGTGTSKHGSFLVKEASLFLDAQMWEHISFFSETWLLRFPQNDAFIVGELYAKFDDLFARDGAGGIGVKVGRFEIPFGEDYLRWDANETPFITFSAADPYGIDEGVEAYGSVGGVHWIAALTNGSQGTGSDENSAKLVAAKLYGDPFGDLYLSASGLTMGAVERSALRFSGSAISPVGTGAASTAGVSPNNSVDAAGWELDGWIARSRRANVRLQVGQLYIDDDASAFDRDLTWFEIEPAYSLRDDLELVLRYSEIGTYEDDEGYIFSGKPVAQAETFGYDSSALRRVSAGARWTINPRLAAKVEVGHDWIDLIDASPSDAENEERLYFGFELVASF